MSTREPTTGEPNSLDLKDHALGAGIGAVYVGWLLSTARGLGFARDEGFYFNACSHYARWFQVLFDTPKRALERASIDASWSANHEHPSLPSPRDVGVLQVARGHIPISDQHVALKRL